ncbi:butyrate kinase [Gracilibacillus salinarum]|uniref:Probable butyrate kinase n=1 Tax=Gracilibacillus salinarum TaxID=2932255 RepID=A0ABY4GP03_9BACI|nr:butyrate kinase [Gracilibacillus salinarum]UOQ85954.1 butyrate kinase [Gracilibacillus salinarum]
MTRLFRILVINPLVEGTRIAIYENEECLYDKSIPLQNEWDDLEILQQLEGRKKDVINTIQKIGFNITYFDAVCGRGGLLRPIEGGTYQVNQQMIDDLNNQINGGHVSNLGALLAHDIAQDWNLQAYIVDPVVVDEMFDIARKTGVPSIERKSIFHALNQKSVARSLASQLQANYGDLCLIIAHIGGGVTVGAHQYGQVIDVNNGFDGDGPLSFERAGSIPNKSLIDLCFESGLSKGEIQEQIIYQSGLKSYLGIERKADLDWLWHTSPEQVEEVFDILGFQIAKEIGKMSAVLSGNVNAIALTGDLAAYSYLNEKIIQQVSWIADTYVFPGENVMLALAQGTLRVLIGKETIKHYEIGRNGRNGS